MTLAEYFYYNLIREWLYILVIHFFIILLLSLHRKRISNLLLALIFLSEVSLVFSNAFRGVLEVLTYLPVPFLLFTGFELIWLSMEKKEEDKEGLSPAYILLIFFFPYSYLLPSWNRLMLHTHLYYKTYKILPFLPFLFFFASIFCIFLGRRLGKGMYPYGSIISGIVFIVLTVLILAK